MHDAVMLAPRYAKFDGFQDYKAFTKRASKSDAL